MVLYPEIIVGTYEEFLLGYEITKNSNEEYAFSMTVASHAHQGSIRSVASHKHLLASSGADEYINIFSLLNKKEVAMLTPHSGTVNCLTFVPDGSHIISASQDGSIAIVRCSDWRLAKIWKDAHKKANGVLGLSVHPSGKLLLSIGGDNVLRAWNLIKGRQAYAVNFGKKITPGNSLNLVAWSQDGMHYAICIGQIVEIYSTETASVVYTITVQSRVSCVEFWSNTMLLGRDDGYLEFHDIPEKKKLYEKNGHDKRIKCAKFFHLENELFLITADSVGYIKLWTKQKQGLNFEAEVNVDCRIVCLALINRNDFVKSEQTEKNVANVAEKIKVTKDHQFIEESPLNVNELVKSTKKQQTVSITHEVSEGKRRKKKSTIGKNSNVDKQSANGSVPKQSNRTESTTEYQESRKKKKKLDSTNGSSKKPRNSSIGSVETINSPKSSRFSTSKWQVEELA